MKNIIEQILLEKNNLSGQELRLDKLPQKLDNEFKKIFDNDKRIVIYDVDADGLCSARIWIEYCQNDDLLIPLIRDDRDPVAVVMNLSADETKNAIVVCLDCGSAADWSKINCPVYVIDHHVAHDYPAHVTMLNPENESEKSSYCTSGLLYALFENAFGEDHTALQYAAIGSVADMVPLLYTTRSIVKRGLKAMNDDPVSIAAKLKPFMGDYDEQHIGFFIAPAINAAGRMRQTEVAVEAIVYDKSDAIDKLSSLNTKRRSLVKKCIESAIVEVKENCVVSEIDTFAEITGLVAQKLMSLHGKPTICVNGTIASFRSLGSVNVQQFISDNPAIISGGGHKNAAGGSFVDKSKLFEAFDKYCKTFPTIKKDVPASDLYVTGLELIQIKKALSQFAPFGMGLKPVIFSAYFEVKQIGKDASKDFVSSGYSTLKLADEKLTFHSVCYDIPFEIVVGESYYFIFEVTGKILTIKDIEKDE